MRKFTLLLLIITVFAVACKTSTEDKLKTAIKEYEKSSLDKGESIESMNIDSVSYETVLMSDLSKRAKDAFLSIKDLNDKHYFFDTLETFKPEYDSIMKAIGVSRDSAKSLYLLTTTHPIVERHRKIQIASKRLDSLINDKNAPKKLLYVSYNLNLKTNQNAKLGQYTLYFNPQTNQVYKDPFSALLLNL